MSKQHRPTEPSDSPFTISSGGFAGIGYVLTVRRMSNEALAEYIRLRHYDPYTRDVIDRFARLLCNEKGAGITIETLVIYLQAAIMETARSNSLRAKEVIGRSTEAAPAILDVILDGAPSAKATAKQLWETAHQTV